MIYVSIIDFFLLFNRPWMIRSLIAAIIIGIVGGIIGTFIILRKVIFLGEAVAHSAFAGASLGMIFGINPIFTIFIFSELSAFSVGYVNQKKILNEDIVIGIIFSATLGLGIIFLSFLDEFSSGASSILFGAILLISDLQLLLVISSSLVVLIIVLIFRKEYKLMAFDKELAQISGLPIKKLDYLFLAMLALLITFYLNSIGAILVFGLFIMPSAAAYMLTYNFKKLLVISSIFGVISGFFGIMISFLFLMPGGPSIIIVAASIFIISYILSPKRKSLAKTPSECKFCGMEETPVEHTIDIDVPHIHDEESRKIMLRVNPKKMPIEHSWKGHKTLALSEEEAKEE